jgi:hypothetical protein
MRGTASVCTSRGKCQPRPDKVAIKLGITPNSSNADIRSSACE